MNETNERELVASPQLGTAEAAVRSCVNLISRASGQPEEALAYWLDLYYQVRAAYEREQAAEPIEQWIRPDDLYKALKELWSSTIQPAPASTFTIDPPASKKKVS